MIQNHQSELQAVVTDELANQKTVKEYWLETKIQFATDWSDRMRASGDCHH